MDVGDGGGVEGWQLGEICHHGVRLVELFLLWVIKKLMILTKKDHSPRRAAAEHRFCVHSAVVDVFAPDTVPDCG